MGDGSGGCRWPGGSFRSDLRPRTLNIVYNYIAFSLVGPRLYLLNPRPYWNASPINYITAESPPTIGFYGNVDPLVPPSQPERLEAKLTEQGVPHKLMIFDGGHYYDWSEEDKEKLKKEVVLFLKKHFV